MMNTPTPHLATWNILCVCTANVSRSPAAAALLRTALGTDTSIRIASAGLRRTTALAADLTTALAVSEKGGDLSGHHPRLCTPEILAHDGRDLIITMSRRHLRELVVADPSLWPRTTTVRSLAPVAARYCHDPPRQLHDMLAGRRLTDYATDDPADTIADAVGYEIDAHRAMVQQLHEHLTPLAELLQQLCRH